MCTTWQHWLSSCPGGASEDLAIESAAAADDFDMMSCVSEFDDFHSCAGDEVAEDVPLLVAIDLDTAEHGPNQVGMRGGDAHIGRGVPCATPVMIPWNVDLTPHALSDLQ